MMAQRRNAGPTGQKWQDRDSVAADSRLELLLDRPARVYGAIGAVVNLAARLCGEARGLDARDRVKSAAGLVATKIEASNRA